MNDLLSIIAQSRRRIHTAAATYIAAVEAALGASITTTQKNAINAYVVAETTAGRWTDTLMWLPIWGNAAANAIELRTLASGAFAGGVTHGSGFVKGNGTTGYFDCGVSASTLGMTTAQGFIFALMKETVFTGGGTQYLWGACAAAGVAPQTALSTTDTATSVTTTLLHGAPSSARVAFSETAGADRTGIITGSRITTTSHTLRRRKTSGVVTATTINANTATPATGNMYALARNNGGTASDFTNKELGFYGMGRIGLSTAHTDAMTLNLKTLWETCTGLTLP